MLDVLIQNGSIADGSGSPAVAGDIAIKDGRIAKIAPQIRATALRVIDATGKMVVPGFIDCHSHGDLHALRGSACYNALEQGVTTQITGQCGDSQILFYDAARLREESCLPAQKIEELIREGNTVHSGIQLMEQTPMGVNMAFFVGYSHVRKKIMDYCPDVPTQDQCKSLQHELTLAMEAGCMGFSTGLVYAPGAYSTEGELMEMARTMIPCDGIYASHIRGEGDQVVDAVAEAIRIGEQTGLQVQISHLKVMGRHNRGLSEKLLDMIDAANARGLRVYADQYPYTASAASLRSRIPPKYHVGGLQTLLDRLRDPAVRKQIEFSIFHETMEFESSIYTSGYEGSLIAALPKTPEYAGMTLAQLADAWGKAPIDAFCELLLANDGLGRGIYFNQNEEDLYKILAHPLVFGGTDSGNYPDDGSAKNAGYHPRGVGTMVRRLQLQRDLKLCSPEEAIRRITGAPAAAFRLRERGLLREGYWADVAVIDYAALHANGTYDKPYLPNSGIDYVLVNGAVAVENGISKGVRNGKILKRV